MKGMTRFLKDEKGLETVEYAVMTALVAAVGFLVDAIEGRFGEVQAVIETIE